MHAGRYRSTASQVVATAAGPMAVSGPALGPAGVGPGGAAGGRGGHAGPAGGATAADRPWPVVGQSEGTQRLSGRVSGGGGGFWRVCRTALLSGHLARRARGRRPARG